MKVSAVITSEKCFGFTYAVFVAVQAVRVEVDVLVHAVSVEVLVHAVSVDVLVQAV